MSSSISSESVYAWKGFEYVASMFCDVLRRNYHAFPSRVLSFVSLSASSTFSCLTGVQSVDIPVESERRGAVVSNDVCQFRSLLYWPKPSTPHGLTTVYLVRAWSPCFFLQQEGLEVVIHVSATLFAWLFLDVTSLD